MLKKVCYVVNEADNVATAMADIDAGEVSLTGASSIGSVKTVSDIPFGHKTALYDIKAGDRIIKSGLPSGIATEDIAKGEHVHMHNMKSAYDQRSAKLDPYTIHAKDIEYQIY